jgi:predicted nucleotidyltransferase
MRNLDRDELITELRRLRPQFEREGVTHLTLFGSRARRDNHAGSDVDLLVEVDDHGRFSLLDLAGVYGIIEDNLGLESSLVMRRSLDEDFRARIETDQVSVF